MSRPRSARQRAAAVGCGAAVACSTMLAGCSGGGPGTAGSTVTVTATSSATSSPKPSPKVTTDVKGRQHDVGTITKVTVIDGTQVVELDRWTVDGMSDPALAKSGVTVTPHRGDLFSNQNTTKTYTAPVAPGARLVRNTCVVDPDGTLGMTAQPLSASSWLASPDPKAILLVTYDAAGSITRLDTDPRCP